MRDRERRQNEQSQCIVEWKYQSYFRRFLRSNLRFQFWAYVFIWVSIMKTKCEWIRRINKWYNCVLLLLQRTSHCLPLSLLSPLAGLFVISELYFILLYIGDCGCARLQLECLFTFLSSHKFCIAFYLLRWKILSNR